MKSLIASAFGGATLLVLAGPAAAQQIPPVVDVKAAVACAPTDLETAVACLDKHLKPEVKADIAKAETPVILEQYEIYVGLWIRNNWGLWTGSPVSQYMFSKRVLTPEAQSNRMVQAIWLKSKGCSFDWNNVGYVVAGMQKAQRGGAACEVTLAEANTAGRNPMPAGALPGTAAPRAARGGAAPAAATAQAAADAGGDED